VRKILGYLPKEFGVYPNMQKTLDYFAQLKELSKTERASIVKQVLEVTIYTKFD
jgi:ABC-type uncharacterized transport system ATPase subunit